MSGIAEPSLQAGAQTDPSDGRSERFRGGTLGPAGTVAAAVVAVAVVAAVWPALLGGGDPLAVHPSDALLAPSGAHPFGTDESGRDVLARVVAGADPTGITSETGFRGGGGFNVMEMSS